MLLPIAIYLGISDDFIRWWSTVDAYIGAYYMAGIGTFFILFLTEIINLRRFRWLYNIYMSFIALMFLLCVVTVAGVDYALDYIVYVCTAAMAGAFFIVTYLLYMKEENASYLFFGLGSSISGHMLFLLYNFGIYTPHGGYWYFYEMSLGIEAFLFSIVLSRKLSHTKALETALVTQKILIRELHHRVKNNLQFIVSLYRLKLKKYMNDNGKTALLEAEQNIHSISKIHEILYNQQNISKLHAQEYFGDLTREIKRGYPSEHIDIQINGNIELTVDTAIYCGLILNELVTNAIKYAFADGIGQIRIDMLDNDGLKTLTVADNGIGFDIRQTRYSFGLNLVEKLTKDELKGEMTLYSNNGVSYTVVWR